jgi:transketolase
MTVESLAKGIRRIVLRESKRAHVGHIGSCLCVADIVATLYGGVLRIESADDPDRDRFILSKGHAALALFAALALKGWIPEAELASFCGDNSLLGVHPEAVLPGVDFSTGSLGQGLSLATGAALAARMQASQRRVYCLISDAECNEGSIWEAAMFAAHHGLDNLTAILDGNGQQAFGRTCDVLDCSNMAERWQAFGWRVVETDGHDCAALAAAMAHVPGKPTMVVARTTFGKGVSYMEQGVPLTQTHLPVHPINWHYLPMSDVEYGIAISETEAS